MKSALILSYICGAAIVGSSVAALALATVTTTASTEIQDSGGIQVVQGLNLATQVGVGAFSSQIANATTGQVGSIASNLTSNSLAKVILTGNAGDAVSLAVSPTLDATRSSGQQKLVVQTFGDSSTSTVLGGELRANGALSVDVGGRVALAGRSVSPGAYQGLLMVIAQYN